MQVAHAIPASNHFDVTKMFARLSQKIVSNFNLERCHRWMKIALRSVANKFPDSWTEAVPWVLYAYRENHWVLVL